MSNLVKRSLSALILGPLAVYIAYTGGIAFMVLVFAMFAIMFYEWVNISRKLKYPLLWSVFGFLYLGFGCTVMFALSVDSTRGTFLGIERMPVRLFFIIALVWINDIASYFSGRLIGGPKLAPRISPKKTWAGAAGGIIGCLIFFFAMSYFTGLSKDSMSGGLFLMALSLHIIIPVVAQIGDLFESYMKRQAGVKDSGNIIPGHGGLLDRMDGVMLVLNVVGIYALITFIINTSALAGKGIAV